LLSGIVSRLAEFLDHERNVCGFFANARTDLHDARTKFFRSLQLVVPHAVRRAAALTGLIPVDQELELNVLHAVRFEDSAHLSGSQSCRPLHRYPNESGRCHPSPLLLPLQRDP